MEQPHLLQFFGILVAYLLGAIPTSVWIGKIFYDKDIRDFGSGNAGATNTFRILGTKAGIPVLVFDVIKGSTAASLVPYFSDFLVGTSAYANYQIILGIAAVVGHVFPIYAQFKGGKGIATLLGVVIVIHPATALGCMLVFVTVLLITKYVSLGSLISSICFPLFVILVFKINTPSVVVFSITVSLLVLFLHKKNILRLVNNDENKISFRYSFLGYSILRKSNNLDDVNQSNEN